MRGVSTCGYATHSESNGYCVTNQLVRAQSFVPTLPPPTQPNDGEYNVDVEFISEFSFCCFLNHGNFAIKSFCNANCSADVRPSNTQWNHYLSTTVVVSLTSAVPLILRPKMETIEEEQTYITLKVSSKWRGICQIRERKHVFLR